MKSNVTSSWKTTVIGCVVVLAAVASVFLKGLSWTEASVGILIGVVLWFAPDKILDKFSK